jgi:hypothetical protein
MANEWLLYVLCAAALTSLHWFLVVEEAPY